MKPLTLTLTAFGSFPGTEHIDFESLAHRGLFVVSGDTGTGKTTIFDAMCWALYGEMPLKEPGGVRSDHAAPKGETRVELTFECEGERYTVTRRPEHERPAKRGTGTVTDPASAQLVRHTTSGTESVATSARDTQKACTALVGLDAAQFQRVVLLPQGEFARFLLANTSEREGLLGALFGGQVFDDIVDELKTRRNKLATEVADVDHKLVAQIGVARDHLHRTHASLGIDPPDTLAECDREALGRTRDTLAEPASALAAEAVALGEQAATATDLHRQAGVVAARFDQAAGQRQAIERLEAQQGDIEAASVAAQASAAARPVATEADALDTAEAARQQAENDRDQVVTGIASGFSTIGIECDTTSTTAIAGALRAEQERHGARTEALAQQAAAATACQRAVEVATAATDAVTSHQQQLAETVERVDELNVLLPQRRAALGDRTDLEARIARAEASLTDHGELADLLEEAQSAAAADSSAAARYQEALDGFVATQAPRLAEQLAKGRPCMVCGSTDHPHPATTTDGSTTSFEEVEAATKAKDAAHAASGRLQTSLAQLRTRLGDDADRPIAEIEDRCSQLRTELSKLSEAERDVEELEDQLTTATAQRHRLDTELAGLREKDARAQGDLAESQTALEVAQQAVEGIDPDEVERTAGVLAQIEASNAGLETLFTDAATSAATVAAARDRLAERLAASPFDGVADARAALLPLEQETAKRTAAEQHATDLTEATTKLATLEEQGIPEQRPDVESLEEAAKAARAIADERTKMATTVTDALTYTDEALTEHDRLTAESGSTRAEHEVAKTAYDVCRNGGALNMSLKRWVLTRELDRVTNAANVHLARMTGHRYSLHRNEHRGDQRMVFGLDLEVLDATTGRPRSTRSLSGGEQFQASLALALGLADVVSHGGTASGRSFEALFVDEGFGSLDPESLDEAIEALHQLQATGRMVGAITHVEAMKQQLHVGIQVSRLPDGGGSTLLVHP